MPMLLAYKLGMMSMIDQQGLLIPITLLEVKPNTITQIKTQTKDGYDALQISTHESRKVNKPQRIKAQKTGYKVSRELRLKQAVSEDLKVGQLIALNTFQLGDIVNVISRSKGKGFAGGIKRHNFSRKPKSHGAKGYIRTSGSIGSVYPQKVVKGKKMAGRMGGQRTTIKGLEIKIIDEQRSLLGIRGAIPGPRRSLITIKKV